MHERTSRALARLLFVGCCAVPTMLTLLTIMAIRTPWYHRRCVESLEFALAQEIGLAVQIDTFHRQTPHRTDLMGLEIRHPETDRLVMRAHRVIWQSNQDRQILEVKLPEVSAAELESAWHLVHDQYLCRPQRTKVPLELRIDDLTVGSATDRLTFAELNARVNPKPHTVEVTLEGVLAVDRGFANQQIAMSVTRDRSGAVPVTHWYLTTDDAALPCSFLTEYLPELAVLGRDATFKGSIGCETSLSGNTITMDACRFMDIDLGQLSANWAQHVNGFAELQLDRCQFGTGRTPDLVGRLISNRGNLDGELIDVFEKHLGCETLSGLSANRTIDYDQLSFWFSIRGSNLQLKGVCQPMNEIVEPEILLYADGEALVRTNPTRTVHSVDISHLMTSARSPTVPLHSSVVPLLRILQPPEVIRDQPAARISRLGNDRRSSPSETITRPR